MVIATNAMRETLSTAYGTTGSWISVHTADPGSNGANEISTASGNPNYARKQTTWAPGVVDGANVGSQVTINVPVGTYTHIGVWTAVSGGTYLDKTAFPAAQTAAMQATLLITPTIRCDAGTVTAPFTGTGALTVTTTKVVASSGRTWSVWHNSWTGPNLSDYPSDVKTTTNLVVLAIAQSGGSGTGIITYGPSNGQSVADHAADIRAFIAAGCRVSLGIGGSGDGGITIQTNAQADQTFTSIQGYVTTYGINGIDLDLEPSGSSWAQAPLVYLCGRLKSTYGAGFYIGLTPGLYDVYTAQWQALAQALGSNNYDYMAPMLYDFPEASDSRLTQVSLDKCQIMEDGSVPDNKMILGYMMRPDDSYTNATPTTDILINAYNACKAARPTIKGAFIWEDFIENSGSATGWSAWWATRGLGTIVRASDAGNILTVNASFTGSGSLTAVATGGSGGVTAPSLISHPATTFAVTTTPQTLSVTTSVGDVVVIGAVTDAWYGVAGTPTNTGTAQTWVLAKSNVVADTGFAAIWTTVSTAAQTTTVSVDTSGNTGGMWGLQAWVWRGSAGVGASQTGGNGTASTPSISLTTTGANSAICAMNADYAGNTGTTTWTAINVAATPGVSYQNATDYSAYSVYWSNSSVTGAKTVAMSAPTGQLWGMVAVEIRGQ